MSIFLDTPETCQRFGSHISEFRSLLDSNHIHHGSPDDIFEFAEMLESSTQFRLDLSAMVKSVVRKESDEILLTDMMSIIVTAVGGSSFAETHTGITDSTKTLMEFLLGTGCWRKFGLYSTTQSQNAAPPLTPPIRMKEPPRMPLSPSIPAIPVTSEGPENITGLLDASNELRQMLTVLETNAQQVKRHLASIEKQIHKTEPPPDTLPTQIPTPPIPIQIPIQEPTSEDIVPDEPPPSLPEGVPVFDIELPTRGRAISFPQPEPPQANDFQSPTFAYATEKKSSIIPVTVFLALLTIIAVSLFFANSGQNQGLLKAGISRIKTLGGLFQPAPSAAVPTAPTATSPSESEPTLPSSQPPPSSARSVTRITPTYSDTPDDANPGISPNAEPASVKPKIRSIPANVMEGYLLSAPRPQYPALARTNHVQGPVILQATISKTGSVETLHVIKGPQPLISAALDAVRNWRYKPFSIDGQPTEVTTTVYVDFTSDPSTATAP